MKNDYMIIDLLYDICMTIICSPILFIIGWKAIIESILFFKIKNQE